MPKVFISSILLEPKFQLEIWNEKCVCVSARESMRSMGVSANIVSFPQLIKILSPTVTIVFQFSSKTHNKRKPNASARYIPKKDFTKLVSVS